MTTLTINPVSEDQETAIRIFLDALHVDYKTNDTGDETDYQMSSSANIVHLKESIQQEQKGEVTKLGLDDIWKE